MLMAILGFVAPFIPDVLGYFKAAQDHKHEREMLELRHGQVAAEHGWRLEEINVRADIEEMKLLRKPHASYGVQLLDKAASGDAPVWGWAFNIVFLAFSFLDWMISSVRPGVTYWIFALYAYHKVAAGQAAVMTDFDQEILTLVISFWFGQRLRARALKGQ